MTKSKRYDNLIAKLKSLNKEYRRSSAEHLEEMKGASSIGQYEKAIYHRNQSAACDRIVNITRQLLDAEKGK